MDAKELNFLSELVRQRNTTQKLLLELLKIAAHEDEGLKVVPQFNSIFQLVVGATFSL
jgi:hypothetical protein